MSLSSGARTRDTDRWYVYTSVADPPLKSVKAKIKTLTPKTSQADLKNTLIRINQISRGSANCSRHTVTSHTFDHLHKFTWWRIMRWQRTRQGKRPPLAHRPHRPVAANHGRGRDLV
jgi:RNA-directed DNA polymerase